jgi:hypothetical protein
MCSRGGCAHHGDDDRIFFLIFVSVISCGYMDGGVHPCGSGKRLVPFACSLI